MRWWLLAVGLVACVAAADPAATQLAAPAPLQLTLAVDSVQPLRITVTVENVGPSKLRVFDRANIGPWLLVLEGGKHLEGCSAMPRLDASGKPFELAHGEKHVVKLGCTLGTAPLLAGGDYEAHAELLGDTAFFPRGGAQTWWEGRVRSAPVKVHARTLPGLAAPEPGTTYPAHAAAGGFRIDARDSGAELRFTVPGNPSIGVGKSVWLAARFTVTAEALAAQFSTVGAWLVDARGVQHALTGTTMVTMAGAWDGAVAAKHSVDLAFGAPAPVDVAEKDQLRFVIEVVDRTGHHAFVETGPVTVTHDPKRDTYYP